MQGIIITAIICLTIFLIVKECNKGKCDAEDKEEPKLIFKKGDSFERLAGFVKRYDHFNIKYYPKKGWQIEAWVDDEAYG